MDLLKIIIYDYIEINFCSVWLMHFLTEGFILIA